MKSSTTCNKCDKRIFSGDKCIVVKVNVYKVRVYCTDCAYETTKK